MPNSTSSPFSYFHEASVCFLWGCWGIEWNYPEACLALSSYHRMGTWLSLCLPVLPCLHQQHHPAVWRTGATPLGSQPSVASQPELLLALQISPSQISNSQEPQRCSSGCAHKPSLRWTFEEQNKTLPLSNPRVFTVQLWSISSLLYSPIDFSIAQQTPFLRKLTSPLATFSSQGDK